MEKLTKLGREVLMGIGHLNFEGTGEDSEDGCPYCDASGVAERIGRKVEAVKGALTKLYKDKYVFPIEPDPGRQTDSRPRDLTDLQLTDKGWAVWRAGKMGESETKAQAERLAESTRKSKGKKTPLPEDIKKKMRAFRRGLASLPKEYIDFHYDRAREELSRLEREHGITIHRHYLDKDGWMDGMRVCYAIIETPSGNLLKLKYNDGNQGFLQVFKSGGAGAYAASDLK